MALTRKMLKAMGIDDEKIDQIIEAHTETVDALKDERDKYRESAEKLPEVQKKLDKLEQDAEKNSSGEDSYRVKYDALKEDFDKYKGEITAKETKGAKEKAFKALLKKIGISEKRIDSVVKVTNLDDIKLDKGGNIIDADALEKSKREEWADFIVTEGEKKAAPETPPTNGGKTPMTREAIMKIKDTSERQAAIAENLELFGG